MDIIKSYPEGTKRKLRELTSGTVVIYSTSTCMLLRGFHEGKRKLVELSSGFIIDNIDQDTYVTLPQQAELHIVM